jgi:NNP family nitrate/nitrite transporter-like MFS transporter
MALLPVCAALAVFSLLARNSPSKAAPKPWSSYGSLLRTADTWRFCLLYSLTFGGFVGLTSFLSVFFHDQYHLSKIAAGDFTTIVVLSGSFLRPVGGWLSDKAGGFRMLIGIFGAVALCLMIVSTLPPVTVVVPLLFVIVGMLGMGNGAVFQMVPQRFSLEIELVTGIVGAAGGLGGFFLPLLLGTAKDLTGTYGVGLACFAICTAGICMLLLEFGATWKHLWPAVAVARARIFSYRGSGAIGEVAAD